MPESRDRLIREDPLTPMSGQRSNGCNIWQNFEQGRGFQLSPSRFNNSGRRNVFGYPLQLRSIAMLASWSPAMGPMGMEVSRGVSMGRVGRGTPRLGNELRRNLYGNLSIQQETIQPRGTGRRRQSRVRNSPLPDWYPRTPLRNITAVVNAIERRTRLREAEHHRFASSSGQELNVTDPNSPLLGAPIEHGILEATPNPMTAIKGWSSPVHNWPKILLSNHSAAESDFLTPQKKLLNSIDQVEKVVMEEFQRMKRTPTAKKTERERKVRTLMAMR